MRLVLTWRNVIMSVMTTWITPDQLSDRLGIAVRTLAQWRYTKTGPPYARFGKHVRYSLADVETWEAERMVNPSQSLT